MPVLANHRLRLIITGKCNLDCFYCHNEGQEKEDSFMRLSDVHAVVGALKLNDTRVDEITISGGEPLLHPDLERIIEAAATVATTVTMVSNGLLINALRLDNLARSGLAKLRLGVDSLQETKPRPSPGRLSQPFHVKTIIAVALNAGLRVDLNSVLTPLIMTFAGW